MLGPEPLAWSECFSFKKRQSVYYGANPLIHHDATPAVIDSVARVKPDQLDLRGAYVVPTDQDGSGGSTVLNPASDPGWHWKDRQAAGATVAQDSPPSVLVVQLSTTADRATSEAIEIRYHMGSQAYVTQWPTQFELRTTKDDCLSG